MQKCLILFLALFTFSVQARANWNPYSMNHERFVHLSEVEKQEVIIKTMEFMVELESKYRKDVDVVGYSPDRFEKYVEAMKKLKEFLISSAYAQSNINLLDMAKKFGDLLTQMGSDGCVYGGYVSKMSKTSTGQKFCQHPANVKGTDDKSKLIRQAYLTKSKGKTCSAPSQISCNPIIFGLEGGKEPFCVPTSGLSKGKAHNVSYECMKKSLSGKYKDEATQTTIYPHLQVVQDLVKGNAKTFNDVHKFVFKTCACGNSGIDSDYAAYIRPHRTCFGMMNTLRVIKNSECSVIEEVDRSGFVEEWQKFFGDEATFPKADDFRRVDLDDQYQKLIDRDAVKAICNDMETPEKTSFECKATCVADGEKKWKCTVDSAKYIVKKGDIEISNKDAPLTKKEYSIDDPKATSIEVLLEGGKTESCPIAIPEEVVAQSCTLVPSAIEGDDTKVNMTATLVGFAEDAKPQVAWPEGAAVNKENPLVAVFTKGKEAVKLSGKLVIAEGKEIPCEGEVPALTDPNAGKKYKIDAVAEPPKNPMAPTMKVNAKVTLDGKPLEDMTGLKISWSRKGFQGPQPKPEEKKKSAKDFDVDEKDKKKEEKKDENGGSEVITDKKDTPAEVGTGPSIEEPRIATQYDSCATLLDAKNTVLDSDCDKITPITAPQPQVPNMNNAMPPQQFLTPTNNTRMMGIQ